MSMRKGAQVGSSLALLGSLLAGFGLTALGATARQSRSMPSFSRMVIDPTVENSSHKPKVFDRFSKDGFNDIGSPDQHGFKLYRYTEHWKPYIIFHFPGNADDYEDGVTADINGDGWPDVVLGGWGNRTIWYEAPIGRRSGTWVKHGIDPTAGWVHASSIQLADFDGDRHPDVCYAEQDQSGPTPGCGAGRSDGVPSPRLVICCNAGGKGTRWQERVLSHHPDPAAGGFNSKVGMVGRDRLPSIVTSLHGFCDDANPILLWRNGGKSE